jgi:hypothetical protein
MRMTLFKFVSIAVSNDLPIKNEKESINLTRTVELFERGREKKKKKKKKKKIPSWGERGRGKDTVSQFGNQPLR